MGSRLVRPRGPRFRDQHRHAALYSRRAAREARLDTVALIFGLILFGLGLLVLIDDIRFRARARRAIAFVLASERVETTVHDTDSRGRYKKGKHVAWKTRFRFKAHDGRDYIDEGELNYQPGEVVTIWYDRDNPLKARFHHSRLEFAWILMGTALIPLGFWVLSLGLIPLPFPTN